MSTDWIRQLCAASILCGAVMSLTPEGGVKRVTSVLCTVILASIVLSAVKELDMDAYALELSRYREKEASFLSESDERSARLNRLVIEEECRTYILDKAGELDLVLAEVQVDAVWSMEGFWVPYAASLTYRGEEKERSRMEERITADLGIPPERQRWQKDG